MTFRRRLLACIALVLVLGGVAYGRAARPVVSADAAARLDDGRALVDSLVAADAAAARDSATLRTRDGSVRAIALGYLERQRLGLGSPFRLIDFARHDPRLPAALRDRLAWAMLGRALRGEDYAVDPVVLTRLDPAGEDSSRADGAAHLRLIQQTMSGPRDPRVSELALRLAYTIAAAERTVSSRAIGVVAPVAALLRDREVAMADAQRLLWTAHREHRDALELLGQWRATRQFAVERPSSEESDEAVDGRVVSSLPALLASIRGLAGGHTAAPHDSTTAPAPAAPALSAAAAARLSQLAHGAMPPEAPVVVAVRTEAERLLDERPDAAAARQAFATRAVNEETLAAEYAMLGAHDAGGELPARVLLAAAVGLRAYGQEAVWFPGDSTAPSPGRVVSELGLRAMDFDDGVPRAWRPYYARMVRDAAADLQRVLPDMSLAGLRVHFVTKSPQPGALAFHDPATRTVVLPIATASGTLAHELGHDLDWQAARRLYARRGTYSTDRAVLEARDRLAASVQGLTTARLIPPLPENDYRPPHDQRPAEVFARNLDWFVSVSLAREGRMNGDLSAVQDELLTGYASVVGSEVGGRTAPALLSALSDVAYVRQPLRDWFLAHWGVAREGRGLMLTRQILTLQRNHEDAPASLVPPLPGASALGKQVRAHENACLLDEWESHGTAQERLAALVADARARGILRMWAAAYPDSERPAWADAVLGAAPWAPALADARQERIAAALLQQWRTSSSASSVFGAAAESRCR